jgi:hypothetical protein
MTLDNEQIVRQAYKIAEDKGPRRMGRGLSGGGSVSDRSSVPSSGIRRAVGSGVAI